MALCECGCGTEAVSIAKTPPGSPLRYIKGHNRRGLGNGGGVRRPPIAPPADLLPSGLCECGCGRPTKIATYTCPRRRHFKGYPKPYIHGHGPAGNRYVQPGRVKRIADGLCGACGAPRGDNGTPSLCRSCAQRHSQYARAARERRTALGLCAWCCDPNDNTTGPQKYYCLRCVKRRTDSNRKSEYGITSEEYDSFFKKQGGRCAICNQTSKRRLAIDHCHDRGFVRGLLCSNCNTGLGLFRDSPERLRNAALYIETTSTRLVF